MKKASQYKILFLASDPTNIARLRLGKEQREIQEKLQLAKFRNKFEFHSRMSVRPTDISQALLDLHPQLIHFSGHGTDNGGLCFENLIGESQIVIPEALADLFELVADNVECVLLNACYSEAQANAISKHINYVIGMNQSIGDKAAIAFAIGFYQALGSGKTIEQAYHFGCVQIRLQGIPEHLTPVLKKKLQPTLIIQEEQDKVETENQLKFFYYISRQKIEMLSSQLETSSTISDSNSLICNAYNVINYLKNNGKITNLTTNIDTSKYIEDCDLWNSGLYSFLATGEQITTYLSWRTFGSTLILLVGSPNNILGDKVVKNGICVPGTSGALLDVLEFINQIKTDEPRAVSLAQLPFYGSSLHNTIDLSKNVVELPKDEIKTPIQIDRRMKVYRFPNVEDFCLNYLNHLPLTRIDTIFKIYSTFKDSDRIVYIGSPLYIAID